MRMGENTGLKNVTHITDSMVFDVTNDEIDDVIFIKSYGWLFPTVTAFGLIVFLAISFTCYHRRIATRKAREDEYAEFLRVYRPDLSLKGLSKPRATLVAFSSNTLDNPRSMKTSCSYINEGFEFSSPCDTWKTMNPNYSHKTDAKIYPNIDSELQLRNNYGNNNTNHHGNANNMVSYYSGSLVSDKDLVHDTTNATIHRSTEAVSHISDLDLVKHVDREKKHGITEFEHVKNDNSDKILCDNIKTDFAQIKSEVTSSMSSLPSSLQSTPKTQSDNGKKFKKRKPILMRKTSALSFDDDSPYLINHYNSPSRQTEPSLYFDVEDDNKSSRVQFNPYYVEIGSRLNSNELSFTCSQRRHTHEGTEPSDYNSSNVHTDNAYSLQQSNSNTFVDVYPGNVEHSTWM